MPESFPDRRGSKLMRYEVQPDVDGQGSFLLLDAVDAVVDQVLRVAGSACRRDSLDDAEKEDWTCVFHFPEGIPEDVKSLCKNLESWLTIPNRIGIDLTLSLDWYTQPGDSDELDHTPTGRLIHHTKHASHPDWSHSREDRRIMLDLMSKAIVNHPLLEPASVVSSPPGSSGDGNSFGELLGSDVANKIGKKFIPMEGPAREQQKEASFREVRDDFELSQAVDGSVILVDDVYRSGATMESAAAAALREGASSVMALTVARTIRN